MDYLREAYGSSDESDSAEKKSTMDTDLGVLPADLRNMFSESVYDVTAERRMVDQRHTLTQWVRRFPHERGNWPTHVFIPVRNSGPFVLMARASISDFRRKLVTAWKERHGPESSPQSKSFTTDHPPKKQARKRSVWCGHRNEHSDPPEVVMNNMDPSSQQHLSLSRTVALRAHQIEPMVRALKGTVGSSHRFTASIVRGYDVLVNDDKTRTFVCLRVRAGRQPVLHLVSKVDTVMRKFNQPVYYEDPVLHVSVASVLGDVGSYVNSTSVVTVTAPPDSGDGNSLEIRDENQMMREDEVKVEHGHQHEYRDHEEEEEEEAPCEVLVDVDGVVCKAGTTLSEVPLLSGRRPDRVGGTKFELKHP